MRFAHEPVFQWLAQYAYEPHIVYAAIFVMMIGSGFGLPIPEEVTIVSVGILAYMGAHPHLFPPPEPGSPVINGYEAAAFTLIAVIFADMLVFFIGRRYGRRIMYHPKLSKAMSGPNLEKINGFVKRYGAYAAFIFRFTPGIRFPAHVFLGASEFSAWKFFFVDSFAALISVPTQILLIYHFGEPILLAIHKFKVYIFALLVGLLLWVLSRKLWRFLQERKLKQESES